MSPPLFLQTLSGDVPKLPPVWFMRQAGRYLPEYRALRQKAGSFLDLCFDPAMATEVTLQPIDRFDLDAAILFADILLIPLAMGQELSFAVGEGPVLSPPTRSDDLLRYGEADIHETLAPIYETVRATKARLPRDKALIGFCGGPWTVATYMLAGGASKDPAALRSWSYREPQMIAKLLDLLIDRSAAYLIRQIDAGADAVQIFDSWAGGLPGPAMETLSLGPMRALSRKVKDARPGTPVILFPKGVGVSALRYADFDVCDAIGVDYTIDPVWARQALSPKAVVQGGLDPLLVAHDKSAMLESARRYLEVFQGAPYVFNLGHGFIPDTPVEHVEALVDLVRRG